MGAFGKSDDFQNLIECRDSEITLESLSHLGEPLSASRQKTNNGEGYLKNTWKNYCLLKTCTINIPKEFQNLEINRNHFCIAVYSIRF